MVANINETTQELQPNNMSSVLYHLLKVWKPYFEIDGITEISMNKEKEVILEINGEFQTKIDERLTKQFLIDFCEQLATYRNLFFNINVPHLSCSIPNTNIRVQAQHHSIIVNNEVCLSMRIPNKTIFPITAFKLNNNLGYTYDDFKNFIINKKNILVSGGTGTGKTSFLNALLDFLPPNDRIITVEDSPELRVKNKNKVQIVVAKNDQTAYTYKDGLNDAMRLRPDRIFVGEIDTRNTLLFLRLSNTGHEGMVSSIHANGVQEAIHAITLNAKFEGSSIEVKTLVEYFASSMDYVIQIKRDRNKGRIIHSVLDVKKAFAHLLNNASKEIENLINNEVSNLMESK